MTNVRPNHCFIPTVSALGFQYQSTTNYQNTSSLPNPYTNLLGRELVCNNEIPFDDFYAPATDNLEHVTTDANAAAFLQRELTPQTPAPVFTAFPTAICPSGTATITVKTICTHTDASGQPVYPTVYDWTLSGPAVFLSTAAGSQTLTGAGNSQTITGTGTTGTATLTVVARRNGAAASAPVTIPVQVAYSSLRITTSTVTSNGCSVTRKFTAGVNVSNLQWYLDGDPISTSPSVNVVFNQAEPSHTITVTANGLCPTGALSATVTRTETFGSTRLPCGQRPLAPAKAAAYPNPADAVLHLAVPETAEATGAPRTAVLYNAQGREVRRTRRPTDEQLPTADLPEGIYYLMVEQLGKVTRSQIQVQH